MALNLSSRGPRFSKLPRNHDEREFLANLRSFGRITGGMDARKNNCLFFELSKFRVSPHEPASCRYPVNLSTFRILDVLGPRAA